MPPTAEKKSKPHWDGKRVIGARADGTSFARFAVAAARNIIRAACVVMVLFGLVSLFIPFQSRFLSDNAMGAAANAAEHMANLLRAGIFIGTGLALFVIARAPRDKSE